MVKILTGKMSNRQEFNGVTGEKNMTTLIDKLTEIATRAEDLDAAFIEAAIGRIKELEAEMDSYKEDITDWEIAVKNQMGRRTDKK